MLLALWCLSSAGATRAATLAQPEGTAVDLQSAEIEGPLRPDARALYDRAIARFPAHDYDGAIADLEAGYAIDPRRDFLFAEAQAKRLSGDCRGAVPIYQRFLTTRPPALQVNAAHIALARCAQELAKRPDVVVIAPPREAPPGIPTRRSRWMDPAGIALAGAAAVGLGVGVAFLAAASSARDAASASTTLAGYDRHWSDVSSRAAIGAAALAAAGAVGAAAVVRFAIVRRHARAETWRPLIGVGARAGEVGVEARF
jgi:hypothetical protein